MVPDAFFTLAEFPSCPNCYEHGNTSYYSILDDLFVQRNRG